MWEIRADLSIILLINRMRLVLFLQMLLFFNKPLIFCLLLYTENNIVVFIFICNSFGPSKMAQNQRHVDLLPKI